PPEPPSRGRSRRLAARPVVAACLRRRRAGGIAHPETQHGSTTTTIPANRPRRTRGACTPGRGRVERPGGVHPRRRSVLPGRESAAPSAVPRRGQGPAPCRSGAAPPDRRETLDHRRGDPELPDRYGPDAREVAGGPGVEETPAGGTERDLSGR